MTKGVNRLSTLCWLCLPSGTNPSPEVCTPEDDLQLPWMILLISFGQSDHLTPILASRAKVAFLAAHPELVMLPNDTGFSLRGPMRVVGLAIREAIQRGVYK